MKFIFYSLFVTAILFSSCNKEEIPQTETGEKKCRISSIDMVYNPERSDKSGYFKGSAIVNYDEKYNIKSVVSVQDSAYKSFSVIYTPTQLTLKTKYNGDWIYKLNNQGMINYIDLYDGGTKADIVYNTEGYISKLTRTDSYAEGSMVYSFIYTDGNLTKVTGVSTSGNRNETIEYTYTKDLAINLTSNANPLYYLEIREVIPGFFGKVSKNQLSTVKQTSINRPYGNGYVLLYNYQYTKDADNIILMKINNIYQEVNPGLPNYVRFSVNSVYNFGYKCD